MDNVDAMVKSIEREPDDLTAVAALTDVLMEDREMTRSEADRHAEKVVQSARDARDLAEAARLMRADQPWSQLLRNDICGACGLAGDVEGTIITVPGDGPPVAGRQYHSNPGAWWCEYTVTVGALWVIRYFRKNPSLCFQDAPTRTVRGVKLEGKR